MARWKDTHINTGPLKSCPFHKKRIRKILSNNPQIYQGTVLYAQGLEEIKSGQEWVPQGMDSKSIPHMGVALG